MNAPAKLQTVEIRLGEALVTIPAELAAKAYLEQLLDQSRALPLAFEAPRLSGLPLIGAEWNGGKFAGLTIHDNAPTGLVLLPGELEKADWTRALKWCEEQSGVAPSRFDQLVLWTNLRDEFKKEPYWSGEQHADASAYAWSQHFDYGNQDWSYKSTKLRVRAVRRVPL